MIAEKENSAEQQAISKRIWMILMVICTGLFLGIFLGAERLADGMGDGELMPLIRVASWMFLFVPFLSVARGYFQGQLYMTPTAVSQLIEQVVRVVVILIAATQFYLYGGSLYVMGTWALQSSWLSALSASIVLVIFGWKKWMQGRESILPPTATLPSYPYLFKRLVTEGLSVSLIASLLIILQFIDSFTVYKGLINSGYSAHQAMVTKGVYDRGQLLVQLAMVVSTGLASGLLPLLRMQERAGKPKAFLRTSHSILRIMMVISSAASVGLIAIMPQVNQGLFNESVGNDVLQVFVLTVVVFSLIHAYHAILQSIDQHRLILLGVLIAGLTKWIGNIVLVPMIATRGASISTVLSMVVMYIALRVLSPKQLKTILLEKKFIVGLALSLFGMALSVRGVVSFLIMISPVSELGRNSNLIFALISAGIGALIFRCLLIRTNVLTIREWLSIPFGKQIMRGRRK